MKKVSRLFQQFQPANYNLTFDVDREAMTFKGSVVIQGKKSGRPSQRLTFHQKGLKVTKAIIIKHDKKGEQEFAVSRINNQDNLNEVRLHSDAMLYPGDYSVSIEFEAPITKPMNGIYPCYFTEDGVDKKLIATQFESHHAREAFPCIDEPEAKATFDLILLTEAEATVLSNTPVLEQSAAGDGRSKTTFETTPRMSVYLLAFVYGDLGYTEAVTKHGVTVRAYATPDKVKLTPHSLQVAVRALDFFTDYFGVPFPLKKMDMAALPDFSAGAMENWGLVTYREVAMLADDKTGSIESKQMVALVVAHELSHQWFGNLVTMKWWDDLWLNESFANMMEYRAVDELYPEWHIWEQFVSSETASAKRRDSLVDVQAIHTEVNHPDEISTLFDPSIVYAKGGSVLYMLMHYIGEETFRAGLKSYFEKHKFGNTQADDLWTELSAVSKQDIGGFMHDWLTRPGYPRVSIDWQPGTSSAKLTQQRFLSDPAATDNTSKSWQVPLNATHETEPSLFKTAETTVTVATGDSPFLFNHDGQSYYLPQYANPKHLKYIVEAIAAGKVSTIDRLLLLDNYNMLQRGGDADTTDLLELLSAYPNEDNESVWGAVALALGETRKLIEGDEASEDRLNAYLAPLVTPLAEQLGWDDSANDDAHTLRLRGLLVSMAAGAKVQSIIDEGLRRFANFTKPSDLSASTRSIVYFVAARYGSDADFTKLLELYKSTANADEKDELASGLTGAKAPERYQQLLELLTTDVIRRQDLMHWYVWLLRNRYARDAAWDWLVTHWNWIEQEFASDKSYSFFARYAGSIFSRAEDLQRFKTFFDDKKSVIAMTRDIALAEQEISSRIAWRERNEAAVKTWLVF